MAHKNTTLSFRRQREKRTDYRSRLNLLKSGITRVILRKASKSLIVQLVQYDSKGDKVLVQANSVNLKKFGWKVHTGNIPSAYLTGLLAGCKAKKQGLADLIVDLGLQKSTAQSRLYAAVKGLMDAGINVKCNHDVLPNEDRIKGKHISAYATVLKEKREKGQENIFLEYEKNKIDPEKIPELFESTKEQIMNQND